MIIGNPIMLGGGAKAFAVIGVTYPAGSTCTCSDGTKTLKLKDTSGQGLFLIPYAATWTVACTDGTNTKSKSVEITSEGQSESVTLSYRYYLYNSSEEFASITGGWTVSNHVNGAAQIGADTLILSFTGSNSRECAILTKNKINFDGTFEKLFAEIDITQNGDRCVFCVSNSNEYSTIVNNAVASNEISKTTGTFSLEINISAVAGEYYVGFYGGQVKATISKVWME